MRTSTIMLSSERSIMVQSKQCESKPVVRQIIYMVIGSHMRDLGMGQFGKVVLAQTIDLSLKDMGMSEDNRIISVLVAVKKLRSKARSAEREAFNKEITCIHTNTVQLLLVNIQITISQATHFPQTFDGTKLVMTAISSSGPQSCFSAGLPPGWIQ